MTDTPNQFDPEKLRTAVETAIREHGTGLPFAWALSYEAIDADDGHKTYSYIAGETTGDVHAIGLLTYAANNICNGSWDDE